MTQVAPFCLIRLTRSIVPPSIVHAASRSLPCRRDSTRSRPTGFTCRSDFGKKWRKPQKIRFAIICMINWKANFVHHQSAHILRLLATHHILRELSPDVFTLNRISSLVDSGKSFSELQSFQVDGRYALFRVVLMLSSPFNFTPKA